MPGQGHKEAFVQGNAGGSVRGALARLPGITGQGHEMHARNDKTNETKHAPLVCTLHVARCSMDQHTPVTPNARTSYQTQRSRTPNPQYPHSAAPDECRSGLSAN